VRGGTQSFGKFEKKKAGVNGCLWGQGKMPNLCLQKFYNRKKWDKNVEVRRTSYKGGLKIRWCKSWGNAKGFWARNGVNSVEQMREGGEKKDSKGRSLADELKARKQGGDKSVLFAGPICCQKRPERKGGRATTKE